MPALTVGGFSMHFEDTGRGPHTVCLVHGSGGSSEVWTHQSRGLADVARVIAVDLPGHGRSGGEGATRIDDSVAAVHGLLDALGVTSVVLGGHSMGGAVAQAYALAHPERLAGLILIGTGARLRVMPKIFAELERDHAEGARLVSELALAERAPDDLKERVYRVTRAAPNRVLIGDFRACDPFDVMPRLGEIAVPTLVVCGAEDRLTPPKYAEFLRARIPGATLVLVLGAGHYVQLERPDETTAAFRDFVVALDRSRA